MVALRGRFLAAGAQEPDTRVPPGYALFVATLDPQPGTPSLDEWIAEVGEEEVAATIRASIQDIESGTTPGFTDKDSFLAYLQRPRHG